MISANLTGFNYYNKQLQKMPQTNNTTQNTSEPNPKISYTETPNNKIITFKGFLPEKNLHPDFFKKSNSVDKNLSHKSTEIVNKFTKKLLELKTNSDLNTTDFNKAPGISFYLNNENIKVLMDKNKNLIKSYHSKDGKNIDIIKEYITGTEQIKTATFFYKDSKLVTEIDKNTGNIIRTEKYRLDNKLQEIQELDPHTQKVIQEISFESDGTTLSSKAKFDSKTGNILEATYYDFSPEGDRMVTTIHDPATGRIKKTINYTIDGMLDKTTDYEPQTMHKISETFYSNNGKIAAKIDFDPISENRIKDTYYKEDGESIDFTVDY